MRRYANGLGGLLVSEEAERSADELVEKIHMGDIRMEILPNTYQVYSGELEEENYLSFCRFLKSHNGQAVIQRIEQGENMGYEGL